MDHSWNSLFYLWQPEPALLGRTRLHQRPLSWQREVRHGRRCSSSVPKATRWAEESSFGLIASGEAGTTVARAARCSRSYGKLGLAPRR